MRIEQIKQIIEGYWNMFFGNEGIKRLIVFRKKIALDKCKCEAYYIRFKIMGKQYNWFRYCKECGCIWEAKFACVDCKCVKNNW